ncbi:hypothetical protein [Microvirga yunnanensis]|uniref:hypothetical protein n=1 Tax=Microvirga yunnanensis TaxID=2953740 RepID=UPI0021C7463D|nr:hypothetical protein [Microvirga sp. HBU65207]
MSLKFSLFAAILAVAPELPSEAHDIYSGLTDAAGASCCDEHDCQPAPYRVSPRGVQMYLDGNWYDVPNEEIQYRSLLGDTGETRGGHWCGTTLYESGRRDGYSSREVRHVTHCVILPPNSTSAWDTHQE